MATCWYQYRQETSTHRDPKKAHAHKCQSRRSSQTRVEPGGSTTRSSKPLPNPCWQTPEDERHILSCETKDNATLGATSQPLSLRHTQSSDQAQVPYACITTVSSTFNSLSKVLCTFPSRYLFTIELEAILRFGWNIPPTWRSRPREHDSSQVNRIQLVQEMDGILTHHYAPFQKT